MRSVTKERGRARRGVAPGTAVRAAAPAGARGVTHSGGRTKTTASRAAGGPQRSGDPESYGRALTRGDAKMPLTDGAVITFLLAVRGAGLNQVWPSGAQVARARERRTACRLTAGLRRACSWSAGRQRSGGGLRRGRAARFLRPPGPPTAGSGRRRPRVVAVCVRDPSLGCPFGTWTGGRARASATGHRSGTGATVGEGWIRRSRRLEGRRPKRRSERAGAQYRTLTRNDAVAVPLAVLAVIVRLLVSRGGRWAAGVYRVAADHARVITLGGFPPHRWFNRGVDARPPWSIEGQEVLSWCRPPSLHPRGAARVPTKEGTP